MIGPEKLKRRRRTAPASRPRPSGDCDGDGIKNAVDADDDNDLLDDGTELELKLDPCVGDTDGDGVEDGYEYSSALDLNNDDYQEPNVVTPYPGKTPVPEPARSRDADIDYDGDGLTLIEEYALWHYTYQNAGQPDRDAHAVAASRTRTACSTRSPSRCRQRSPRADHATCRATSRRRLPRRGPTAAATARPQLFALDLQRARRAGSTCST